MGVLSRFKLSDDLVEQYPIFIETGTGKGVSLSYAAQHKFKRISSIEYDERLESAARRRFKADQRVHIIAGNSAKELPRYLSKCEEGTPFLFWLDAHWPGSDYYGDPYEVGYERDLSLPLARELREISSAWRIHQGRFIAIIDDISTMMMRDRGMPYLFELFADTHNTIIYPIDEGYAVIEPKGDGPRPELIKEYNIYQLMAACERYIQHDHWSGAGGFAGQIMALTDGGIDPPDVGAKMVGRGMASRYFAAEAVNKRNPGIASDLFIQAMGADPLCLDYRMDYIYQVLLPVGWRDLALTEAKRTVKIFPDEARSWLALVEANRRLGNKEAAITAMVEARKRPEIATVGLLGAQLAADLGEFEESYRLYDKVMTEHPERTGEALVGMGVALGRDGQFETAIATFDRAYDVGAPDPALCKWNRAETLLTLGRYKEGWPDHGRRFELELKVPGTGGAASRFRRPMLTPEMPPCRVHLQGEQGFGDVICMARYAPMLVERGHEVQLEVDPKLFDLLSYSLPGVNVVPMALDFPGWLGLEKFGNFDAILPCMCFPAFFSTTTDTVPWAGPYLKVPGGMAGGRGFKPRVGLCWSSGRRDGIWENEYCSRKSVPREEINKLVGTLGDRIDWHLFDFPTNMQTRDDTGANFMDSAHVLSSCDLLITCDTAMAHLGGALGVPTWVMMHGPAGSWHWMSAKAENGRWESASPWYPSVKLYRQELPHEWGNVIARIADDLTKRFV